MANSSQQQADLELSFDFSVAPEVLYRAWTEEDQLRQWWRPMGNRLLRLTQELKPGGRVEYVFETNEGEHAFTIHGNYKIVQEGRHLVYSWNWDVAGGPEHEGDFVLDIYFEPRGEGTRLQVRQLEFEGHEAVQPHREGWEQALKDLEAYVSRES